MAAFACQPGETIVACQPGENGSYWGQQQRHLFPLDSIAFLIFKGHTLGESVAPRAIHSTVVNVDHVMTGITHKASHMFDSALRLEFFPGPTMGAEEKRHVAKSFVPGMLTPCLVGRCAVLHWLLVSCLENVRIAVVSYALLASPHLQTVFYFQASWALGLILYYMQMARVHFLQKNPACKISEINLLCSFCDLGDLCWL